MNQILTWLAWCLIHGESHYLMWGKDYSLVRQWISIINLNTWEIVLHFHLPGSFLSCALITTFSWGHWNKCMIVLNHLLPSRLCRQREMGGPYKFGTFFPPNPTCSVKPHTSKKTRGHSWLEALAFSTLPLCSYLPRIWVSEVPGEGCPMQKQPLLRGAKPTGDVCGRAAICAISSRLQSPPWGDGGSSLVGAQPPLAIITVWPCPRALGCGAMGSGTATQEPEWRNGVWNCGGWWWGKGKKRKFIDDEQKRLWSCLCF